MTTSADGKQYCAYCGRVTHRCRCPLPDSAAQRFFARNPQRPFAPSWRSTPYIRGVPPQVKQRERAALRRQADAVYAALVAQYGAYCLNCGAQDVPLVLDHVVSVARGGKSTYDNLQLLCAECNRIKGKLCIDCRRETP